MLVEVINTIHQLVAAFKKHKGIKFTDKDSNIIDDTGEPNNNLL